jgi:catechol 2,3-dioxygenase-like lactoylglutathione lyase family enzyme
MTDPARPQGPFEPLVAGDPPIDPEIRIGHVHLRTADIDRIRAFYVDLMGFDVEWEPDSDNVYLSSGVDNLALHRSTAQPGASQAGQTLDHLGLIVRAAEDVDRWASFLESRGVAIDAAPRTHRDGARSCYVRDPDGNRVQIIHHPPISRNV